MKRLLLAALAVASACASTYVPHPTKDHGVAMCAVTCGRGGHPIFSRQHLCSGGASRFFTDFIAVGEHVERNGDGTLKVDDWIGMNGDYPKTEVETMPCAMYIQQLIASRDPAQRGQHPGEDPLGRPTQ